MESSELQQFEPSEKLLKKAMNRAVTPAAQTILDAVAERLFERLDLLKAAPSRVIDLGTGDARHLAQLQMRFKNASVVGVDLSLARLQHALLRRRFWQKRPLLVCLDADKPLPFAKNSFDLVLSNMMLPWLCSSEGLVAEINRVLVRDGAYFLSTAGPDTLIELRQAWAKIDDSQHINMFLDMHDVGDLMVRSGMADPVMDTERITVTYSSLDKLLDELTALGFINVLNGRRRGLTALSVRQRLEAHYPKNNDGGVDATLELVTAHGWSGVPKAPPGEYHFDIDQLKLR